MSSPTSPFLQQQREQASLRGGQIGTLGGAAAGATLGAAAGGLAHALKEREDKRNWFQRLLNMPPEQEESPAAAMTTGALIGGALGGVGGMGVGRYVGGSRFDDELERRQGAGAQQILQSLKQRQQLQRSFQAGARQAQNRQQAQQRALMAGPQMAMVRR